MPISVVCPGCTARFTVSDRFAGQTGPCPKCKKPITIPAAASVEVTVHEPEPAVASGKRGRGPTAPIVFQEKPLSMLTAAATTAGAVGCMLVAVVFRAMWGAGGTPTWVMAAGAVALAFPSAWIAYAIVRDRELQPYRGMSLVLRCGICAAAYALLWGVHAFLPAEQMSEEFWRWLFVGPVFGFAGALAAFAALDLDWGTAGVHFACYVLFTALLRWILGFPPV
jgi:hypothetical protein